jgi:hypothetical protein
MLFPPLPGKKLNREEAQGILKEKGVSDIQIPEEGLTTGALDYLVENKQNRDLREERLSRSQYWGVNFAGSLVSGLTDPAELALGFVPVIRSAKYAELTPSTAKQVTLMLETIPESSGYKVDPGTAKFFGPGKGCATCNGRAYKGRVGIYEIFTMNKEIEKVILSKEVSEYTIGELARKDGMITMGQDGLLKALDGLTSVEEVLSVANFDASLLEPEEEVPNGGIPPAPATS